jgi:hypothetical protein
MRQFLMKNKWGEPARGRTWTCCSKPDMNTATALPLRYRLSYTPPVETGRVTKTNY